MLEEVFELNMQLEELKMNKQMERRRSFTDGRASRSTKPRWKPNTKCCFKNCSPIGKIGTPLINAIPDLGSSERKQIIGKWWMF